MLDMKPTGPAIQVHCLPYRELKVSTSIRVILSKELFSLTSSRTVLKAKVFISSLNSFLLITKFVNKLIIKFKFDNINKNTNKFFDKNLNELII
jgi:hypothetical protein